MAREAFQSFKFRAPTLLMIEKANAIITEYQGRGYTLTLRQLYYQFVSRDLIPNKQEEYKKLGDVVNKGRLAGLIDWSAIEDRTRNLSSHSSWSSPASIMRGAAQGYAENPWRDQPYYVEVWVEKEALAGVIEKACETWRVPHFSCRGYVSQSEQYAAAVRLREKALTGKMVKVFHLGDHDPSGIDMTRDNRDRLHTFSKRMAGNIEIERLALHMEQIEEYSPPPNPAKDTDSRFEDYRNRFGDESWELDALDPTVIEELIESNVEALIDRDAWDDAIRDEEKNRDLLDAAADRWDEVADFLNRDDDE